MTTPFRFAAALLGLTVSLTLTACPRGPDTPPTAVEGGGPTPSAACGGDVVGAWSPVVSGLRARLVAGGSKPDRSALDVTLEVENVSGEAVELAFTGYVPLGFATFRLDDAQGHDVEPEWRFGGSSPSGDVRALFRARETVRYDIHRGAFVTMSNKRALRIGAFWGRELPSDGSKRFLRAILKGTARLEQAPDHAYEGTEIVRHPPATRPFAGVIEVPAICLD